MNNTLNNKLYYSSNKARSHRVKLAKLGAKCQSIEKKTKNHSIYDSCPEKPRKEIQKPIVLCKWSVVTGSTPGHAAFFQTVFFYFHILNQCRLQQGVLVIEQNKTTQALQLTSNCFTSICHASTNLMALLQRSNRRRSFRKFN